MLNIHPFRGVLYNPEKIRELAEVTTPPYDVITPEAQEAYYRRHANNIVRLDLGKITPGDGASHNRYTRAAADFRSWREQQVLIQDDQPAYYRYEISYAPPDHGPQGPHDPSPDTPPAPSKTLKGFFAAVGLEPYHTGNVLPHEDTFPKVKEDRLYLLRACRANFSPIICLYEDPEDTVRRLLEEGSSGQRPGVDFTDEAGMQQRMWGVQAPDALRGVQEFLRSKKLLIADGHHRYETALAFQKEDPKADRMLMLLVNLRDQGLSVLPTHRVLRNLSPDQVRRIPEGLSAYFTVDKGIRSPAELQDRMRQPGQEKRGFDKARPAMLL